MMRILVLALFLGLMGAEELLSSAQGRFVYHLGDAQPGHLLDLRLGPDGVTGTVLDQVTDQRQPVHGVLEGGRIAVLGESGSSWLAQLGRTAIEAFHWPTEGSLNRLHGPLVAAYRSEEHRLGDRFRLRVAWPVLDVAGSAWQDCNARIAALVRGRMDRDLAAAAEVDAGPTWQLTAELELWHWGPGLVSVAGIWRRATGGPQAAESLMAASWIITEQKARPLTWSDVTTGDEELRALMLEQLRQAALEAGASDVPKLLTMDQLPPPFLTATGLHCWFAPYVLSGTSDRWYRTCLSWNALRFLNSPLVTWEDVLLPQ